MSESVLVTGAAGFVGANLVRRLVADGHRVHVLVPPRSNLWRLRDIVTDIAIWPAQLEDREAVENTVRRVRPAKVFHLAAHGAYPSQRDVERMVYVNVLGTVNLVEACLRVGVECIVNTGSSSEYGYQDGAPGESDRIDPNSHYAVTKAAATLYCRHASLSSGTPVTTLRLYSIYGPWEEPTRLLPTLVLHALRGELPPLVSPSVARDYVYVDDAVEACLAAARADVPRGSVFNVATGRQTRLAELVDIARSVHGVAAEPAWGSMPARSWDTDVWFGDPAAIATVLGWRASTPLELGYRRLACWFDDPAHRSLYERTPGGAVISAVRAPDVVVGDPAAEIERAS